MVASITVAIIVGASFARGHSGTAYNEAPRAVQRSSTPAASPVPPAASPSASASAEVAPITIVGTEMKFAPSKLTIPANTAVTVMYDNRGVIPHNIRIDELGIDIDVGPHQQATFIITAAPGTYRFYCDLPGHTLAGMRGTLTVV